MPRKLYIGTNTKMYKTIVQTEEFLGGLAKYTSHIPRGEMELFVIPSFTSLQAASVVAHQGGITLGAQNMGWEDEGQFTGEISPIMLDEVGVRVVEIGHSERRHILGESDEMENRKVRCALRHGFTPLLCVGETEKQKQMRISDEILRTQVKIGLYGLTAEDAKRVWVAYEPVWAIGVNGKPAGSAYANQKHAVIRDALAELFGPSAARDIPLLYGGSVNEANAEELISMAEIDGLFIGRSAWDAGSFSRIIHGVLPVFRAKKQEAV